MKHMRLIIGGSLAGILVLWALASRENQYDQGRMLYTDRCQSCHGETGNGQGPDSSGLNPRPTDFAESQFWSGDADRRITESLENGHKGLSAFDLTPTQIKDLINYMSHAFKK